MIDVSEKRNRQLNWLLNFRIRLFLFVKSALKDHIVFSTEPESFCGVGKVALISVYFLF